jgi:hypothetical protein
MSKLRKRYGADRPVTSPYKLWAAWFAGATAHHHPGRISAPLHPDTSREFQAGQQAASQGYVNVPDYAEAWGLIHHVQAGNPPHTYRRPQ